MDKKSIFSLENAADKITAWVLLIAFFLTPLFFIPSGYIPFQLGKTVFIYFAIVIALIAWIIGRLKDGKIGFTRHYLLAFFVAIPLVFLISALFSGSRTVSLVGHSFEIGTFSFIAALFIFGYLVSELFTSNRIGLYSYLVLLVGFIIVALFHIIRLFAGPDFLSFGVLGTATSSLVGSWNDAGIYFGSIALFSFISLEVLKFDRWIKWIFIASLVVSLFLVSVVGLPLVWYVLGAFSIIFFVYRFTFANGVKRSFPIIPLVVLIVSCVFILAQGNIYGTLATAPFNLTFFNHFSVSNVEVRPSVASTASVAWQMIKTRQAFLGTGPNRFTTEWLLAKPAAINNSVFWNTDFNYGVGLIPTFLVTTGIIGLLAWIGFFVFFLWLGFKALFMRRSDSFKEYITVSSFIIALYLWIFAIMYVPSAALLFMTMFFTGLFIASLSGAEAVPRTTFNFIKNPKTSFVSVLVFVALILGILVLSYSVVRRFVSNYYFNQGVAIANAGGDVTTSENNLIRAIQFSPDDVYYRALTTLNLAKINILLSSNSNQTSQDVLQNQFRTYLSTAQSAATAATSFDSSDYQNWISLGNVYESIVPLNIDQAYESAVAAYMEAAKRNPLDPSIDLILARLEMSHKDSAKAKEYISKALTLKSDYTDAIFFLSQIQVNEGDLKSAIQSVQAAALVSPNDPGIYFQLGLLRYNDKDYQNAASAFEQAVALVPEYANAKYFLGLSYYKLGRSADAIAEFQAIAATNPDSAEVKLILSNLEAGKDPFANVAPPLDNKPEKRPTPPLKEKGDATASSTTAVQ